MTRIALFCYSDANALANAVNDFIKDKKVIDVQYQSMPITTKFNANAVPLGWLYTIEFSLFMRLSDHAYNLY